MSDIIERLAIEQAVYNAIGADLKTGVPDNLRGQVEAHYRDLHDSTGADRFRVQVNGIDAGVYRFDSVGGKPRLTVTDMDALQSWDDPDFEEFCGRWVAHNVETLARKYFESTGVIPDGMELTTEPEGVKGVYTASKALVANVRAQLEGKIAGLLGE